jgi:hypothetical protein
LRERVQGHLTTLAPLFRPKRLLGDHVQGTTTDTPKNADGAVKELTALHDRLAAAKPFSLRTPLSLPLRLASSTIEIAPLEYTHATAGGREISVRSPLKWTLSYTGFAPNRLREILSSRQRSTEELHDFLVNYLVLHLVFNQQSGAVEILRKLHFPVTTERIQEFGDLPVTCVTCDVTTMRPSDDVINRSVELSGMDAFEEIIRPDDVIAIRDPLKDELMAILSSHGYNA